MNYALAHFGFLASAEHARAIHVLCHPEAMCFYNASQTCVAPRLALELLSLGCGMGGLLARRGRL